MSGRVALQGFKLVGSLVAFSCVEEGSGPETSAHQIDFYFLNYRLLTIRE